MKPKKKKCFFFFLVGLVDVVVRWAPWRPLSLLGQSLVGAAQACSVSAGWRIAVSNKRAHASTL